MCYLARLLEKCFFNSNLQSFNICNNQKEMYKCNIYVQFLCKIHFLKSLLKYSVTAKRDSRSCSRQIYSYCFFFFFLLFYFILFFLLVSANLGKKVFAIGVKSVNLDFLSFPPKTLSQVLSLSLFITAYLECGMKFWNISLLLYLEHSFY